MSALYYGTDTEILLNKVAEELERFQRKYPNGRIVRFDSENFSPSSVLTEICGGGLFALPNLIILDRISLHEEGKDFYKEHHESIAGSMHTIVVREDKIDKPTVVKLEKSGITPHYFELQEKKAREEFTIFDVAMAFGARDKKRLWVAFDTAKRKGSLAEEIHGTIFWAVKTMLITALVTPKEAGEIGVKEYSYRTYKAFTKNYSITELRQILSDLKEMYHEGHEGGRDLEVLLERYILSV